MSTKMGLPDRSLISTVPHCLKHFRTPYIVDSECSVSRAIVGPFSPAFYRAAIVTRLKRRVPLVEQELLTLPEHMSSPPVFSGVRVTRSLVLYVCFVVVCPFVLFLLAIVLSVLFRYTDSDCPFGIFKLSLHSSQTKTVEHVLVPSQKR